MMAINPKTGGVQILHWLITNPKQFYIMQSETDFLHLNRYTLCEVKGSAENAQK